MTTQRTFLGISKPSEAVRAMIQGLKEQSKRPDFVIDMITFGEVFRDAVDKKWVCFGCAATCTLQFLANKNFTTENITLLDSRAEYLECGPYELNEFEYALDAFRRGDCLFRLAVFFYGINYHIDHRPIYDYISGGEYPHFHMSSDNWEEKLPIVESIAVKLESMGY